jgi:hypothetical protein
MTAPSAPGAVPSHRRILIAFAGAVVVTAAFAATLAWRLGGDKVVLYVSDIGQFLAALVAAWNCFRLSSRQRQLRTFWLLLGAACGAWVLGQAVWMAYELVGRRSPPDVSWADVGYLAFIPLTVAALLCHPGLRGSGVRKTRSLVDGFAIAMALLFLSWMFVLGPLWRNGNWTTLAGVVNLAYPLGDVVIAFFVVLALNRMTTPDRLGLWFLLAGLSSFAFSDSAYAYFADIKGYETGNLIDTGWSAGFLGIALGAFASRGHRAQVRAESHLRTLPSRIAPLVPMLLALCVAAFTIDLANRPDWIALTMVLVLVVLALVRLALYWIEYAEPPTVQHPAVRHPASRGGESDLLARAVDHYVSGGDRVLPRSRSSVTHHGYAATLTRGVAGERFSGALVLLLVCASAGISMYDLSLILRFVGR